MSLVNALKSFNRNQKQISATELETGLGVVYIQIRNTETQWEVKMIC
jgi:hypothetical protein